MGRPQPHQQSVVFARVLIHRPSLFLAMSNLLKSFRTKTLVLSSLVLLSAAAPPLYDTVFKSSDHKKLGKLIGAYYEAKTEQTGISDARGKLESAIAKLMKKHKDYAFLSMVEDVEEALYLSRPYKDSVPKGRATAESFENVFDGLPEVEYAVHAPKSYKSAKGPFPLLLCFTEEIEVEGKDKTKETQIEDPVKHIKERWEESDVLGGAIIAACKMPKNEADWGQIRGGLGNAMQVMNSMKKLYAVDGDKVFVVGTGKSLDAAMRLAAVFPDLFAGVIGRAGDMGETSPTNFRNVATYFTGGGSNCTAYEKAAKEIGIENCTIKADGTEADIWEWVQATRRNPHPLDVTISPIEDVGRAAYWVSLIGFDPSENPTLRATIDRDTNTIDLVGKGISSVNLYFNDALVDLDKTIFVNANGVKHEIVLTRRLDVALDWCYDVGDRTRAYVNSYRFDLPDVSTEDG